MGYLQPMRRIGRAELPRLNEEREESGHDHEQRKRIGESSWTHRLHLTNRRNRAKAITSPPQPAVDTTGKNRLLGNFRLFPI
jgi:hypothetical protein